MTNTKKYYWLKLKDTFFQDKEIKKLRKIAGGDTYTIIYLKMQLLSLKEGGKIIFDRLEDTFADELALILDEEPENVKVTLLFLERCGLIEEVSDNEFILPQAIMSMGSETEGAERVRRHRQNKLPLQSNVKPLQCNADVTKCNTEKREKRKEKKEKREELFFCFYEKYPNKKAKAEALKAWNKIDLTDDLFELIISKLELYKKTEQWQKDNGKFIPMPATWINQKRWEDDIEGVEKDARAVYQEHKPIYGTIL